MILLLLPIPSRSWNAQTKKKKKRKQRNERYIRFIDRCYVQYRVFRPFTKSIGAVRACECTCVRVRVCVCVWLCTHVSVWFVCAYYNCQRSRARLFPNVASNRRGENDDWSMIAVGCVVMVVIIIVASHRVSRGKLAAVPARLVRHDAFHSLFSKIIDRIV